MDFTNEFTVEAPLATAWEFMQNAEEVTPCVPGAAITEQVDDTHYKGTVKVKLGAVQMSYRGEMEMVPNEAERTITLHARGRETRGSGGASGTVTTRLVEVGEGQTKVEIHSQIDVTGRVAQFGRGIMQDVANRLIKDFATCLEQKITASMGSPGAGEEPPAGGSSSGFVDATPPEQAATTEPSAAATTGPGPSPATISPPSPPPSGAASPGLPSSAPRQPTAVAPNMPSSSPTTRSPQEGPAAGGASELSISQLLLDVFRSRAAGWLRSAADRIEPK